MRSCSRLVGCLIALLITGSALAAGAVTAKGISLNVPALRGAAFTKNMGQWPDEVLFRTNVNGAAVWLCRDRIVYQFVEPVDQKSRVMASEDPRLPRPVERVSHNEIVVTARFDGSNPQVSVSGDRELSYKCNFFLGNDPSAWRTDVPSFRDVTYHNLYPGIDLRLSSDGGYAYLTRTQTSLSQVRIRYEGEEALANADGAVPAGSAIWSERTLIVVEPAHMDGSDAQFDRDAAGITATSARQTVANVSLEYSTYLGGTGLDIIYGAAVGSSGSAYVVGETSSTNFPTQLPFQGDQTGTDVFVSQFSADGSSLIYSTYLGGSGSDIGRGIAVDLSGNVFITGSTQSTNYPTQNQFQTDQTVEDAFVTKLSADGSALVYSTYLGGGDQDKAYAIAVDTAGAAYITGMTWSTSFPVLNQYQSNPPNDDAFVTKLSPSGNSLSYSTYLGGGIGEVGYGIAVDSVGNAYVTGATSSTDFPTVAPFQVDPADVNMDAFVTKLSASGNSALYSTYLGGSGNDEGYAIAVDVSGSAYVTGRTSSTNFPTQNPYQTHQNANDMFVTKFSGSGNNLAYSTYLGGNNNEAGGAIKVDALGYACVVGYTLSSDFPVFNEYQGDQGQSDATVTKLAADGGSLLFSTYVGGANEDYGTGLSVDTSGAIFVVGDASSTDFPVLGGFDISHNGGRDGFVAKMLPPVCCSPGSTLRGDIAMPVDNTTDGSDLGVCVDYVFFNDESAITTCAEHRDVNNDASFDGGDLGILVDYIFFNDTGIITRCDGSPF